MGLRPDRDTLAPLGAKECGDYGLRVRFLAYTDLRWGEVAALHTRRVDLDRRRAQIVEAVTEVDGHLVWGSTKTHARRTVPLPRFLARDLPPWVAGRRGDDLLFPAPGGGVLRVRTFRRDTFDPVPSAASARPGSTPTSCGTPPRRWRSPRART